jgi:hypothetical protein
MHPEKETPNCWEALKCPNNVRNSCPAYPDMGRECWKITGTKCSQGRFEKSSLVEQIVHCHNECEYYRQYLKE